MDLKISLEQKQVLSQRMIQSVEILQMNVQELDGFLKDLSLENPLVELEEAKEAPAPKSELQRKLEWLEAADEQNSAEYVLDEAIKQLDGLVYRHVQHIIDVFSAIANLQDVEIGRASCRERV